MSGLSAERRRRPSRRSESDNPYLVILLSSLFVLLLALQVDPLTEDHPMFARGGDHLEYISMARAPYEAHSPPYCYRLLVPSIARILPFGLAANFYLLTLFFLVGTGAFIYYLLRELGEDKFFSMMGVTLFYSLNWGAKFNIFDFWLTDPGLFFFSSLALLFAIRGRLGWVSLSLFLAVLCKEAALFMLPLVYTIGARRPLDTRALVRAIAVSAGPFALYFLLRLFIPATMDYSPLSLWSEIGIRRLSSDLAGFIRGGTVGTWGILLLVLPFFSGREGRDLALRSLPFLVLVYVQPLFAVNIDRLLVFAFLVVIPLSVKGLRRISLRFDFSRWTVAVYAFIPLILILVKSGYQTPSPEKRLLVLAIWTLAVIAVKFRSWRKNLSGNSSSPE